VEEFHDSSKVVRLTRRLADKIYVIYNIISPCEFTIITETTNR
jgi:hypothetical protein